MIGAILGPVFGALAGGMMAQRGQASANQANAAMAMEQMRFQARMSSSAHVREVRDLKRAGLNPILSANAGASTPAGAQAVAQNTEEGLASAAKELPGQIMEMRKAAKELELLDKQKENITADTKKKNAETSNIKPGGELKTRLWDKAKMMMDTTAKGIKNIQTLGIPNPVEGFINENRMNQNRRKFWDKAREQRLNPNKQRSK